MTNEHELLEKIAGDSWKLLPEYGHARTMNEALRGQRGSCLHRSVLIGRSALSMNLPALRGISFGSDQKPFHFCNFIRVRSATQKVSTNRTVGSTLVTDFEHGLDPEKTYMSTSKDGIWEVGQGETQPHLIGQLYIPEPMLRMYAGCLVAIDYIDRAYALAKGTKA